MHLKWTGQTLFQSAAYQLWVGKGTAETKQVLGMVRTAKGLTFTRIKSAVSDTPKIEEALSI
jgi:hypothetical protein